MILPEGTRKLFFFSLMMILAYVAYMLADLPHEAYESTMWAAAIGFGGGNVGEHFAKRNN